MLETNGNMETPQSFRCPDQPISEWVSTTNPSVSYTSVEYYPHSSAHESWFRNYKDGGVVYQIWPYGWSSLLYYL